MTSSFQLGFTASVFIVVAGLSSTALPECSSAQQVRDHRPCCTENRVTGCKECYYKPRRPQAHNAPGGVTGGKQVKPPPR